MWPFRRSLVGKHAPDIIGEAWFNITALPTSAQDRVKKHKALRFSDELLDRVVIVDFWDYSSKDCIETLILQNQWWKQYQQLPFLIIGVHSPEFAFATNPEKVEAAVLRFEINYPVVSDSEYATWEKYRNKVWPRKLIVDQQGIVRYDGRGAKNYHDMETVIQRLLSK